MEPHTDPPPERKPRVYLSSALTDVPDNDRADFYHLQDRVEAISQSYGFDVYVPRHATDPRDHPDVSAFAVYSNDRHELALSDVVVALVQYPSFGVGQELEIAKNSLIPIIIAIRKGERLSRMVRGIPTVIREIQYESDLDLRDKLGRALMSVEMIVRNRAWFIDELSLFELGRRIKIFRQSRALTESDFGALVGIRVEEVAALEDGSDLVSNPSIFVLRRIAMALSVPLSDLMDDNGVPPLAGFTSTISAAESSVVAARHAEHVPTKDAIILWTRRMRYEMGKREQE